MTVTFYGTGIEIYAYCNVDRAMANVYIDGELKGKIDTYQPNRGTIKVGSYSGLENKKHTMEIRLLLEKNSANNSGYYKTEQFNLHLTVYPLTLPVVLIP